MTGKIFWAAVAGFLIGVFLRSVLPIDLFIAGVVALLGVCIGAAGAVHTKSRPLIAVAVALVAAAFGTFRMDAAILVPDISFREHVGERVIIEGFVFAEPDARQDSVRLSIQTNTLMVDSVRTEVHGGVLAKLPAHAPVSYGDRVRILGILREPQAFDSGYGRQFDYPGYLAAQGISFQISPANLEA